MINYFCFQNLPQKTYDINDRQIIMFSIKELISNENKHQTEVKLNENQNKNQTMNANIMQLNVFAFTHY